MKKLMSVMALFVISLLAISMVSADTLENKLEIDKVEVNGQEAQIYGDFIVGFSDSVDDLDAVSVDEGEVLEIEVELEAKITILKIGTLHPESSWTVMKNKYGEILNLSSPQMLLIYKNESTGWCHYTMFHIPRPLPFIYYVYQSCRIRKHIYP